MANEDEAAVVTQSTKGQVVQDDQQEHRMTETSASDIPDDTVNESNPVSTSEHTVEEKKEADGVPSQTAESPMEAPAAQKSNDAEASPSFPERQDTKDAVGTAENPSSSPATSSTPSRKEPTGKGAQIFMNRFQSIRERANQNAQSLWSKSSPALSNNAKAVQERAENFWKQAAPKLPANVPGFRTPLQKTTPGSAQDGKLSSSTHTTASGNEKDGQVDKQDDDPKKETAPAKSAGGTEVQPNQFSLSEQETTPTAHETNDGSVSAVESESVNTEDDIESSAAGASDASSRLRVGQALTKASLAASVAYESVVATGFRGRYTTNNNDKDSDGPEDLREPNDEVKTDESVSDTRPMPESQTELILKSRAGQYMQEILDKLEPHEYAMLLGRGMLGVNLKQCYLKNHGVFIDFLVPGGQAETSGVVRSGDLPVRLGESDLRKGTILDIPVEISKARRPVVLTFATGTKVSLERINFIDVAVAMMHRARDYYTKRGTLSNLPSASSPNRSEEEDMDIKSVTDIDIPAADTIDSFLTPPAPTLDIRQEFWDETPLRCLDKFMVEGLCQVHDMDVNFREAVRNAFLTCALDSRRLPFLSRHFSSGDVEVTESSSDGHMMTSSTQLMLFLELTSFLDLYHVTPKNRLREMAKKIAHKFFLPTNVGNRLQPPLFDFHHMVPDASLRHLETVLKEENLTMPRDIFFDFSKAVLDSLAGAPFISFLISSECARMRAYLRNTAPYVTIPFHEVTDALVGYTGHSDAKDTFAYILLFLICQVEKEPSGEHNFGNEQETKSRLLGASNDLCCALFIRRTFLPAIQKTRRSLDELKDGQHLDATIVETLVKASETFWSVFIAGTMELSSRREETETIFNALRLELERVAVQVLQKGETVEMGRETAETFLQSTLEDIATTLAEELLYNYAAYVNIKFREHKFHEWMCSEISKACAKDQKWNNKQEIPSLPQGCIKRLLRKAELPEGVSSHKPFKENPSADSQRDYPNAEFAVVFGSAIGNELASETPIPGIEASDIRRYTCRPVALDREHDKELSSFSADDILPPTFESYAIVPPKKPQPFRRHAQGAHFSGDGWEVSLVSFTVPNAESSGANTALYGVSLFFQCSIDLVEIVQNRVDAFVHEEQKSEEGNKEFQSPIQMSKTETTESEHNAGELGRKGMVKNVSVTAPLSAFNDKHRSQSWVSRILGDEYRDPNQPISIGLALVSRQNVILSMRDALSRLLFDYSEGKDGAALENCGVLVDVLGNFAYRDVESISLRCVLEPYLKAASAPWIERPIAGQVEAFERMALQQVITCIPPTPLALLFIAVLLEQKIILSSSRRSVLQSTTVALSALSDPLKWSHLLVPMVPASLVADLIQYPAPFILGIPSEDAENAKLTGNLPRDVTLVDLDVGRVILAPQFGLDNEMVRKSEDPTGTANALRSQVLYLAQALGTVFGNSFDPQSWLCDAALPPASQSSPTNGIEALKSSAKSFVSELLEGVSACCYWIEEAAKDGRPAGEPTVLFDEDKFFEIKNRRTNQMHRPLFRQKGTQEELALSVTDFDLVLESFLRCQSMSTYISSRPKTDMVYY